MNDLAAGLPAHADASTYKAVDQVEIDEWKEPGIRGRPLDFETLTASLAVTELSFRKGVFTVEEFLICRNRECRFLISLWDGNKLVRRVDLILSVCPECAHEWSSRCPFCLQTLTVVWQNNVPSCSHCRKSLQPEAQLE